MASYRENDRLMENPRVFLKGREMLSVAILPGIGALLPLSSWQRRCAGRVVSFASQAEKGGCLVSKSGRSSDSGCNIYQGGDSLPPGAGLFGTLQVLCIITHNFLSRPAVRKLPTGTDSEAKSLTAREPMGLMLAKERGSFGMRPHWGCRETRKPAFNAQLPLNGRGEHHCSKDLCLTVDLGIERSGLLKKSS